MFFSRFAFRVILKGKSFSTFKPLFGQSPIRFYSSKKKGKGEKDEEAPQVVPTLNLKTELGPEMEKYVSAFQHQLSNMKTGKITPQQLENLKVKLGKDTQSLKALANIIVKSPRQIVISAYDKASTNPIESALYAEDIGLSVQIEGVNVNVTVPQMTKEIREGAVKQAKKQAEMTKENIRKVRHDGQKLIKATKGTKDQLFAYETALQKLTDEHVKKIDDILVKKEQEILKI